MPTIKTIPAAYISTLGVILDHPAYTTHSTNDDITTMLAADLDFFSRMIWFYPYDVISGNDTDFRSFDTLEASDPSQAATIAASHLLVQQQFLDKFGFPIINYFGKLQAEDSASVWQALSDGDMQADCDRFMQYCLPTAPLAIDASGSISDSSNAYCIRMLDYLTRVRRGPLSTRVGSLRLASGVPTRSVVAEAAASTGKHLHSSPGLTTLAFSKLIPDWSIYSEDQTILLTQTIIDDLADPVPPEEQLLNRDYISNLIPLVQLGFYVARSWDNTQAASWPPSWWSGLISAASSP